MEHQLQLADEAATQILGQQLAFCLKAPMVIYLEGNLGAGKTTLVRALLQQLGYKGTVKSPTYTLVEEYTFPEFEIFHFDLYRLKNLDELFGMGFEEYLKPRSICLIEWPEKLGSALSEDLKISFSLAEPGRRVILSTNRPELAQKLKQCIV
ncbi:MAG TPA: tRNA (adenosine(37)-N6)-threonylcarbamoyltransferase complex ATPase subunit type 1 TsaE [Coxiellaceae bacterium]|nr:tRNA (adenosine(37)-N6)-threonylcarbamoyltransferase complex ATPase subunit type 1 TsaE [Coxiellaceae bacterium]